MMKRDWHLLFSEYDLRSVLEAQLAAVDDRVLQISERRFEAESDDLLAASVASDLVVSPLVLLEDAIAVSSRDAKIDVSHDQRRLVFDRSRPAYVDGIEVTYALPFAGDQQLLQCRPSSFTPNPPRAVIGEEKLLFPYDEPDRNVAATKPLFWGDLSTLKQWLSWVNDDVGKYNASLEPRVRERVIRRRNDLMRTKTDLQALGFRVIAPGAEDQGDAVSSGDAAVRRESSRRKAHRTYDVALSFAGEDRTYVEQVAEELRQLGVTVFYDGFEQVNLWGKDLAEHLGQVYSKDSRFVVIFASRAYAAKAWPNHEKQFALGRHLRGDKGRILPVRFDQTEIPGIPPTIGYLDIRVLTPRKLAELIRQKVDADA